MKQGKRARVRRLLGLLLIAIPWFLRDQIAATFEKESQELNSVLVEHDSQQQSEEQARYQRDLATTLASIDLRLEQQQSNSNAVQQKAEEMWKDSLGKEGAELQKSAENLEGLLDNVKMSDADANAVRSTVQNAKNVAQQLQHPDSEEEDLFEEWDKAETALSDQYDKVLTQAEKDRDSSSEQAGTFRFIAWIFTAIGAAIVGDWWKLVRDFTGGGDETSEEETSEGTEEEPSEGTEEEPAVPTS